MSTRWPTRMRFRRSLTAISRNRKSGLQFSMPLGFRRELATVRNQQLLVARERAVLQDQELELSHQLTEAVRVMDTAYAGMQTNFNRVVAARDQVDALESAYEAGTVTVDLVLDAQRRLADALSSGFRSQADYNRNIAQVHFRKGSLLEYNDVYLAEGPWPAKAYFDAHRRARARDAAYFLDYGFTRPDVISRGPINGGRGHDARRHDARRRSLARRYGDSRRESANARSADASRSDRRPRPRKCPPPGPATMKPTTNRPQFSTTGAVHEPSRTYDEEPATEPTSKKDPSFDWKIDRASPAVHVAPSNKAAAKSSADPSPSFASLPARCRIRSRRDAKDTSARKKRPADGWKKATK